MSRPSRRAVLMITVGVCGIALVAAMFAFVYGLMQGLRTVPW